MCGKASYVSLGPPLPQPETCAHRYDVGHPLSTGDCHVGFYGKDDPVIIGVYLERPLKVR